MGDTHADPCDHARTTHGHYGIAMKDNYYWPGLALLAIGVLGMIGTVAAAAYRHHEFIATTGLIAICATVAGAIWLVNERRRVQGIEERWFAEHPDKRPHLPAA
ncbi:MAG: UsfY protein [Mycobacteriaceae bacterium]|nr:UsfY protein [Mycobacteriaceae bacterium]